MTPNKSPLAAATPTARAAPLACHFPEIYNGVRSRLAVQAGNGVLSQAIRT